MIHARWLCSLYDIIENKQTAFCLNCTLLCKLKILGFLICSPTTVKSVDMRRSTSPRRSIDSIFGNEFRKHHNLSILYIISPDSLQVYWAFSPFSSVSISRWFRHGVQDEANPRGYRYTHGFFWRRHVSISPCLYSYKLLSGYGCPPWCGCGSVLLIFSQVRPSPRSDKNSLRHFVEWKTVT